MYKEINIMSDNNNNGKAPNDFIVGLITFVVFVFFMTAWMYFST